MYKYMYTSLYTHLTLFHTPKILTFCFLTLSNFSDLLALQDENTGKFYGHRDTKLPGSKVYHL